jgi:hypothetical protein
MAPYEIWIFKTNVCPREETCPKEEYARITVNMSSMGDLVGETWSQ